MSELKISDKCFLWKCKKIHGGEELLLLLRVRCTHTHTHTQSVFTYSMRRNVISHNTGEGGGGGDIIQCPVYCKVFSYHMPYYSN